ncbi:TPA: hypothetical protein RD538_002927 [Enterococcus faecium]|nr:hypothetical protein [Enterococcus faecium]
MAYSTIGVVVEKSRDNLVFVTEIQTGRSFVVTDKAAKAYRSGDILALNLITKRECKIFCVNRKKEVPSVE